jgi:MscS family membrane protein
MAAKDKLLSEQFLGKIVPKNQHRFLNRAIVALLFLIGLWMTILYINDADYLHMPLFILKSSNVILTVLVTYLVTTVVLRLTDAYVYKMLGNELDHEYRIFLTYIYNFLAYMLATAFILYSIGVSASNLTVFLGLATTGIAFAIRDVLLSFLAWSILLTKKPFKIGDAIRIGDDEGKVTDIRTFYVTLDPGQGDRLYRIPNRTFIEKSILNYGSRQFHDKVRLPLKRVPDDISSWLEKIKKMIQKKGTQDVVLNLSYEHGSLCIDASYLVDYAAREQTKLEVQVGIIELSRKLMSDETK